MQKSDELRGVYERYLDAMSRGDVGALEELFSHDADVSVIGTDPDEWWSGHESTIKAFRAQAEAMGGSLNVVPGDNLQAYAEGDVGWVTDQPKVPLPSGELTYRHTMVFRKEDGHWRIVHSHASFGVGNEEVFGKTLAA